MKKFRTHYDNLKISRDAPDYIVRAAYKVMVQKYHPDKNPGDSRATKILSIINGSYAVLSDPIKRKEHDDWILKTEAQINSSKVEAQDTSGNHGQNSDNYSHRSDNHTYGEAPDNVSSKSHSASVQTNNPKFNGLKNIIIGALSIIIFKLFGVALGLTAVFSYLTWTIIGSNRAIFQALATLGVLTAGILYWQSIAKPHLDLTDVSNNLKNEQIQQTQARNPTKIESNSLPATNKYSKPTSLPAWISPSDSDLPIQTTIGEFSKSTNREFVGSKEEMFLNGKPIADKYINENSVSFDSALDFGGNVVLFYTTYNGGSCRGCEAYYASSFDSNGVEQSTVKIPYQLQNIEKWRKKNGVYNFSEVIPIDGNLFTAILNRDGVTLTPHAVTASDEAPKELCSFLYNQLSETCTSISISDCAKIIDTDFYNFSDFKKSDKQDAYIFGDYATTYIFYDAQDDPRININEFRNICRSYCEGDMAIKSKNDFAKSVCNLQ